ncbi:MAG TPA: cell division protein CrgA [Pseudonocardiaceae bacterium]|nr:cell division protein CrgA [Pseudonocardiaceae bacterium]
MPKSKIRKKSVYTPPAEAMSPAKVQVAGPSHPLYVGVMLGMMLLGLLWLVVNYLAVDKIPLLNSLGNWNFMIGFTLMIIGLLMTMRWR